MIFFQINLVDKKRRYTFAASNKKRNRDILITGEEKRKSSLFFLKEIDRISKNKFIDTDGVVQKTLALELKDFRDKKLTS